MRIEFLAQNSDQWRLYGNGNEILDFLQCGEFIDQRIKNCSQRS